MAAPRYTVIVPMRSFHDDETVLASLRASVPPDAPAQILVAEGSHPALQRNAALHRATGEIVVFLDNDCALAPHFWNRLEAAFARPEVEIVGGPARLRPEASPREQIFHALLTHPLVVGPISARYAPRGSFRATTQMELILCNLAVRRSIFARIGPLSTQLYPNEENEWLDRAQAAGVGIFYDPELQVFRPQRTRWREMALMLLRYGMGRTRQFMVSGWRPTPHQFLPFVLIALLVAIFHWQLDGVLAILWLAVSATVALSCAGPLTPGQRLVAGLVAPLLPLIYAIGQLLGWPALLLPVPVPAAEIVVRNERGEAIKDPTPSGASPQVSL